ncbi:hypothetical protein EVA_04496 [gut metagenome]|uniref:Uncharacterized protein n=1 Tax=gut metagenome TaxID=749906 RepID=J9D403_9ZZZZ
MIANNYLNTQQNPDSLAQDLVIHLEDDELELFQSELTAFFASIPYTPCAARKMSPNANAISIILSTSCSAS